MKKYLLSFLLLCIYCSAFSQFKYKGGTRFYMDAGLQLTNRINTKISISERTDKIVSFGLAIIKPLGERRLSVGLETKISTRRPTRRAGFLLHGCYYKSVIRPYEYSSFDTYELGFGGLVDNFSFTLGVKNYLVKEQDQLNKYFSAMFQTTYHFGWLNPKYRELEGTRYSSHDLLLRKEKENKRLYGPAYFDASIGKSLLLINMNRSTVRFQNNYSMGLGWQWKPWLGIGVNYTLAGLNSNQELRTLGLSWRARPRKGYYKVTVNIYNQLYFYNNARLNGKSVAHEIEKQVIPIGLGLEGGIRISENLFLKVGCSSYLPYNLSVSRKFVDKTVTPSTTRYDTMDMNLYIGNYHFGIGFIL